MKLNYYAGAKQFGLLLLTMISFLLAGVTGYLVLFGIIGIVGIFSLILDAYKQGYIQGKFENDIL